MLLLQGVLLVMPRQMGLSGVVLQGRLTCHVDVYILGLLYTTLLVPLMIIRYLTYHREKNHYFMIDFCYYAQYELLLVLWYYGEDQQKLFQAVYSLVSGPLAGGIIMWSNSLVLHDLGKQCTCDNVCVLIST
jgi:hypothetical protein